jgi:hypothetical protein
MTPESLKFFVKIIREHFRLKAENTSLKAILDAAVRLGKPIVDWPNLLKQAQATDNYRSISQQHSQLLDAIEQSLDETELVQLLENVSKIGFLT